MTYEEQLNSFDQTIIKLAKTYHIEPLEWKDVAQELRLHLWEQRAKYDPTRPFKDWAYITCRNRIKNLAKYYHRQKRHTKIVSLEEERLEEEQNDP